MKRKYSTRRSACRCVYRTTTAGRQDCLCPATELVQIVGRKYTLPLISLIAVRGTLRFSDIRSEMNGMSTSTLSIRLAELEREGLIQRRTGGVVTPRVEYKMTREGERLRRSLIALVKTRVKSWSQLRSGA